MFFVNDVVRCKPGARYLELGLDISGWEGTVVSAAVECQTTKGVKTVVEVDWDTVTMKNMPYHHVITILRNFLDFSGEWVEENDLELAPERLQVADREQLIKAMKVEYEWVMDEEQFKRISAVDDGSWDILIIVSRWHNYLLKELKLPIEAIYLGDATKELPHAAEILITKVMEEFDSEVGVVGEIEYEGKILEIPLSDVDVLDEDESNQPLLDYVIRYEDLRSI